MVISEGVYFYERDFAAGRTNLKGQLNGLVWFGEDEEWFSSSGAGSRTEEET